LIRTVRLTPAAERDLARLVDFLVERNPRTAERAGEVIKAALRSLTEFSERGRQTPIEGLRELVIRFGRRAYIAQYRIGADEVVVARIFHSLDKR
jgi:toxin ParE1/3/4